MALMERVSALIRANLNDLVDKAEDPEKMIKQVILDMENQLIQVKTQVAIAMADQHLLVKKQKDNEEKHADWMRKAGLRRRQVGRRAGARRTGARRQLPPDRRGLDEQIADQKQQTESLRTALRKLEQKLVEAKDRAICSSPSIGARALSARRRKREPRSSPIRLPRPSTACAARCSAARRSARRRPSWPANRSRSASTPSTARIGSISCWRSSRRGRTRVRREALRRPSGWRLQTVKRLSRGREANRRGAEETQRSQRIYRSILSAASARSLRLCGSLLSCGHGKSS